MMQNNKVLRRWLGKRISVHVLVAVVVVVCLSMSAETRSYNNGLIFYDLQTRHRFLPPTVSVARGRSLAGQKYSAKGSIWSTFGKPCDCSGPTCGCCAGINVKQYNFDQKMCANVTFLSQRREALLDIFLNDEASARYAISARNPSPFCVPVMLVVPMAMCVQMSNVVLMDNNLNMCMDFMVRLASTDFFEMHFQCMRMGVDGLQYLDKNGQPLLAPGQRRKTAQDENRSGEEVDEYEYYDESAKDAEADSDSNQNQLESEHNEAAVEEEETEQENAQKIALKDSSNTKNSVKKASKTAQKLNGNTESLSAVNNKNNSKNSMNAKATAKTSTAKASTPKTPQMTGISMRVAAAAVDDDDNDDDLTADVAVNDKAAAAEFIH